ncbi:hypothetical protein F5X99DRAFT_72882 [Biscogniauxia marginata]|nr:hypothetical protein F5X99DRAFT_72882 [Biscogniauxia marginata]
MLDRYIILWTGLLPSLPAIHPSPVQLHTSPTRPRRPNNALTDLAQDLVCLTIADCCHSLLFLFLFFGTWTKIIFSCPPTKTNHSSRPLHLFTSSPLYFFSISAAIKNRRHTSSPSTTFSFFLFAIFIPLATSLQP